MHEKTPLTTFVATLLEEIDVAKDVRERASRLRMLAGLTNINKDYPSDAEWALHMVNEFGPDAFKNFKALAAECQSMLVMLGLHLQLEIKERSETKVGAK